MTQSTSTSPPQQFPSTSSIAPPVQNSASVTFAPAPTTNRTRAYSTSASGVTSPTSPAFESMAAINIEAMTKSPTSSASASSVSPPSAPLASYHALHNATGSPPPGSGSYGKSTSAGYEAAHSSLPSASTSQGSANSASSGSNICSAMPFSPSTNPSYTSSAASRRHSVDPYSQRQNNNNSHTLDKSLNNSSTALSSIAAGHRRHHQSISVPPSSASEYSSLGDLQNHQSSHLQHQLNSRYRKSSLGSQALLSPTALDHMSASAASALASAQNGPPAECSNGIIIRHIVGIMELK